MEKSKELPKGVCPSCWGKKYNTQMYGEVGYPDFIGDKGFKIAPEIHNIPCSKCNGTGKDNVESNYKVDNELTIDNQTEECKCECHNQNLVARIEEHCALCDQTEECKHEAGIAGGVAYCKKCGLKYQTEEVEDWEKEFEEMVHAKGQFIVSSRVVKSFISNLLSYNTERVKKEIEKGFNSFLLTDWSGEQEVYEQIERLKEDIIKNIK